MITVILFKLFVSLSLHEYITIEWKNKIKHLKGEEHASVWTGFNKLL